MGLTDYLCRLSLGGNNLLYHDKKNDDVSSKILPLTTDDSKNGVFQIAPPIKKLQKQ